MIQPEVNSRHRLPAISADGIVTALAARGLAGPVLVVADAAAIAAHAPAWAAAFAGAGIAHRVVVAGVDVAAAAAGLGARVVVAAGSAEADAARAAAALGIPAVAVVTNVPDARQAAAAGRRGDVAGAPGRDGGSFPHE